MRVLLLGGDEGTFLTGAVRVAEGQIPFRDFFEAPGPGSFYWLALFFKLFGTSFLTARISLALTTVCTALLMYFLTRRLTNRYSVMPAIFFLATSFGPVWPAVSHHHDSDLFALLSFTALLYWIETRRWFLLLIAGVLAWGKEETAVIHWLAYRRIFGGCHHGDCALLASGSLARLDLCKCYLAAYPIQCSE
jgi:predicted membrane-bound mannosyltransferase